MGATERSLHVVHWRTGASAPGTRHPESLGVVGHFGLLLTTYDWTAMRFDKLTIKAQEAVTAAQERASANQHAAVTPMHLLAAMVHESEGGIVKPIVEKVGAHLPRLQQIADGELERLPKVSGGQLTVDLFDDRLPL